MATNFSPCKGSFVLNQFPSNVMFGMNGFQPVERYRAIMALLFFSTTSGLPDSKAWGEKRGRYYGDDDIGLYQNFSLKKEFETFCLI